MIFLYEQSYDSDSNPFENYARADFTKSFRSSMTSIYAQHSLDLRLSARDRNWWFSRHASKLNYHASEK